MQLNTDSEHFDLLQAPAFTIASNAGFDGALVIAKLLEQDNHNLGFDATKGLFFYLIQELPSWPTLQFRIPFLISGIQFFSYWRLGSCLEGFLVYGKAK